MEDAFRQRWFELGREFQRYVLETKLKHLYERGLLDVEEKIATETGHRKPDFALRNLRVLGEYLWIGDAKLGEIMLDDQMKGLIDEATRTTLKTLVLVVPDESSRIPDSVKEHAKSKGIRVIPIPVPWVPEWAPEVHLKQRPKAETTKPATK